jgi:hypothetical protein
MRKLLLASVIALAPIVAFAAKGGDDHGVVGRSSAAVNVLGAGSLAGVASTQGTMANSSLKGTGYVVNGAIAGNYTTMNTGGKVTVGNGKVIVGAGATQTNIGGVVMGATGSGKGVNAYQNGGQTSTAVGGTIVGGAIVGGIPAGVPE